MRTSIASLVALAAATSALAESHAGMAKHRRAAAAHSQAAKRANGWTLDTFAQGQDFLNLFNFETGSTNGGVANYVSEADAWAQNLVAVNKHDGTVHLRVSTGAPENGLRNSLKLVSKATHNQGLFIIDIERQPQVCGAWPAVWMTSLTQEWPAGGEIDIVEYVDYHTDNAFSVHTSPGCWAGSSGYSASRMLLSSQALNCDAHATDSQGCGFRSKTASAGAGINAKKGGAYVVSLTDAGVSAWFFGRQSIPEDITSKNPNPANWGTPDMHIDASSCNPISNYFQDLGLIINTNLAGTWPEGIWNDAATYAGQDESCAQITGASSAAEYVLNNGAAFRQAYWKIRSLAIYK